MIYVAHIYVQQIARLQDQIDAVVKMHPHLKDIVPKFGYDRNNIGPNLLNGLPLYDPKILIKWDDGIEKAPVCDTL